MPASVYQRNGVGYRPPLNRSAAVRHTAVRQRHDARQTSGNAHLPTTSNNAAAARSDHRAYFSAGPLERPAASSSETRSADVPPTPPAAVARSRGVNDGSGNPTRGPAPSSSDTRSAGVPPTPPAELARSHGVNGGSGNVTQNNSSAPLSGPLRRLQHALNPFSRINSANSDNENQENGRRPGSARIRRSRNNVRIMRIYIQAGMRPGQNIRVLCPDQGIRTETIPSRSEWLNENGAPFFRVEFDPSNPGVSWTRVASNQHARCTCVPHQGVFDSACPCHETSNNSNGDDGDLISIAQDEGDASIASAQNSVSRRGLGWECKACSMINELQNEACQLCRVWRNGVGERGVKDHGMLPATLNLL